MRIFNRRSNKPRRSESNLAWTTRSDIIGDFILIFYTLFVCRSLPNTPRWYEKRGPCLWLMSKLQRRIFESTAQNDFSILGNYRAVQNYIHVHIWLLYFYFYNCGSNEPSVAVPISLSAGPCAVPACRIRTRTGVVLCAHILNPTHDDLGQRRQQRS